MNHAAQVIVSTSFLVAVTAAGSAAIGYARGYQIGHHASEKTWHNIAPGEALIIVGTDANGVRQQYVIMNDQGRCDPGYYLAGTTCMKDTEQ